MLQLNAGVIQEIPDNVIGATAYGNAAETYTQDNAATIGQITFTNDVPSTYYWPYTTWWGSYPVAIYSDKTKKAIEVLKALQAAKLLKCDSVPRFIELVEKIAGLL